MLSPNKNGNKILSFITIEKAEKELKSTTQFIPIEDDKENKNATEEKEKEVFDCPVCYTDGSESGIVKPSSCAHSICLNCYTNIVLRIPNSVCPLCRKVYLPELQQPEEIQHNELRDSDLQDIEERILDQLGIIRRIIDIIETDE